VNADALMKSRLVSFIPPPPSAVDRMTFQELSY
jgi:hypothetical protein